MFQNLACSFKDLDKTLDMILLHTCNDLAKIMSPISSWVYINVGMANCEKRPKQERDDIRFTHIAIPTSFYIFVIIWKCVLLEHVLISYTGGVCYLWVLEARWESSESGDDAYSGVLGGHVA